MALKARNALADCKHALDLLQQEARPETFRVFWVAGVALARAVGHILQKVDGEQDARVKRVVATAYAEWKAKKQANLIFWDFIEQERNQVLKEYEISFAADPVKVVSGGEVHTLDDHLFCPIIDGTFAGEDCRDILEQAIAWWDSQLSRIESSLAASSGRA